MTRERGWQQVTKTLAKVLTKLLGGKEKKESKTDGRERPPL